MKNFLGSVLGPRLREARKAKALTSIVCAKAVGVSQPAWNMWEMGVRLPKIELLTEVCDLLEVTPNHLLGYDTATLRDSAGDITHGANSPIIKVNGNHNTIAPPQSTSPSTSPSTPKRKRAKK